MMAEEISGVKTEAARREMFLRLMEEYGPALRRLAGAYVSDARDREDLVQEIAVGLWQAIPKFRAEASERTWTYRIAHNTAITAAAKLRRRGRAELVLDEWPEPRRQGPRVQGEEGLIRAERRHWLLGAIRELGPEDRQIVTLHLEELSHREIAEITGISEGAIATRLTRIRERLAARLRGPEVRTI